MRPGVHTRVRVVLIVILAEDDGASFLSSGIPPNVNKISSSSVIFLHKKKSFDLYPTGSTFISEKSTIFP